MSVIARNQWGPKPLAVRVDAYGNPREARRLDVGPPLGEGEVEFVPADRLAGAVDLLHDVAQSGVSYNEPRVGYVEVQIDLATWEALAAYRGQ
jgi:transcription termination factor Rho